jgi:hypothetical protein
MSEKNKQILAAVVNTLNRIEVHGHDNLDMMLGCIRTIRKMLEGVEDDG